MKSNRESVLKIYQKALERFGEELTLPLQRSERHKVQASHNQSLLQEACFSDGIQRTSQLYNDWAIIVAFYAALHYVQMYLSKNKLKADFDNHTERIEYLKYLSQIDRRVRGVTAQYISLYKFSRLCRYTPCYFHYLRPSDVRGYLDFAFVQLPKDLGLA